MAMEQGKKVEEMTPEEMADALYLMGLEAAKAKDSKADSIEAKMAKAARQLLTTPDAFGIEANTPAMPKGVVTWLEGASTLSADAFDRQEGDLLASIFDALSKVPANLRPAGFDKVADKVPSLIEAWMATKPGRRSGSGSGESTTPASQKLVTFGIESVTLTMTSDKLDAPVTVTHGSTWSSLSAEINKVAKRVDDKVDAPAGEYSYQKVDPKAGPEWRAFVEQVKAKPDASATFSIKLAKGTLKVEAKGSPVA